MSESAIVLGPLMTDYLHNKQKYEFSSNSPGSLEIGRCWSLARGLDVCDARSVARICGCND